MIGLSWVSLRRVSANFIVGRRRREQTIFSYACVMPTRVDLRMSTRRQHFSEVSAKDFQNVVDMTAAPAHKWMFLHGESFGWYPYQHEPWHWEYNPSGFRDAFRESVGLPLDEDEPEGGTRPVVGEDEGQAREDATD